MGSHGQLSRRVQRAVIGFSAGLLVATLPSTAQAAEPTDPEPLLGGQLYSTGSAVTVEVLPASAGLTSTLFLLDPEEVQIATNRDVGTTKTVGPYGSGTELVFGIRVGGQEFRLGPGGRNPDGIPHAVVDFGPDGCAVVGFEDLFGGGDRDYDDNKFKFCGGIAPEVPEDPEEPPTPGPDRSSGGQRRPRPAGGRGLDRHPRRQRIEGEHQARAAGVRAAGHPPRWDVARCRARRPRPGGAGPPGLGLGLDRPGPRRTEHLHRVRRRRLRQRRRPGRSRAATSTATAGPTPSSTASSPQPSSSRRRSRQPAPSTRSP